MVDHQSVILEYSNGVTVAFSLMPMSYEDNRLFRICGSEATLRGSFVANEIRIFPHSTGKEIICDPDSQMIDTRYSSHGGGNVFIISAFLDWLDDPAQQPKTTIEQGWEAMVITCGIDLALKEHRGVEVDY